MNNEREQKHACMENKLSIALGNLKNIEKYLKDHDKQMKLNYPDGQPEPSYEIVLLENAKKSLKQFLELENAIESGELVQVVRCRDCMNAEKRDYGDSNMVWCNCHQGLRYKNQFCSESWTLKMDGKDGE